MEEHEHRDRFERAERLLRAFDARLEAGDAPDLAVLDEVEEVLDRTGGVAAEPEPSWVVWHYLRALWHRSRARLAPTLQELDAAIREMRLVVRHLDLVPIRIELMLLVKNRYVIATMLASVGACERPRITECVEELRGLVAREHSSEAQRGWMLSLLGQVLCEQFRTCMEAGESPAPELLDEAEDCLDRSLDLFDADTEEWHEEAMLHLARVRSSRSSTTMAAYARDQEANREEAILLFEQVATGNPGVALELAELWQDRFDESGDPSARAEALRWLDESEGGPEAETRAAELAYRRGRLWLSRAHEDPAELPALIEYLAAAFETDPVQGRVGLVLLDTYWLAGDAEGIVRVTDRLAGTTDGVDVPPAESMSERRAIAVASLALRGRAGLAEAEQLLRRTTRSPVGRDWPRRLALGLLVAVRIRNATMPEWLAASVVGKGHEVHVARELLGWLGRHEQPGPDWICAVAALSYFLQTSEPGPHPAALRATIAARAALAESGDAHALELLVQQAVLVVAVAEEANDRDVLIEASTLLEEFLDKADARHRLRSEALGLYGTVLVLVHSWGGGTQVTLRNATAALEEACADMDLFPGERALYLTELARAEQLRIFHERIDLFGSAIDHCRQALVLLDEGSVAHDDALLALGSLLYGRFNEYGDRRDLQMAVSHLRALKGDELVHGTAADFERELRAMESLLNDEKPDPSTDEPRDLAKDGESPAWRALDRMEHAKVLFAQAQEAGDPESAKRALDVLMSVEGIEVGSALRSVMFTTTLLVGTAGAGASGDTERFLRGIAELETVRDDTTISEAGRAQATVGLVELWVGRHRSSGNVADLDEALRNHARLDPATLNGADATLVLDGLADSCWSLAPQGYGPTALSVGFDSLRLRARSVQLQSQGEHAVTQAADAAVRGQRVALWCAALGELDRAVEAVEWGRGLLLHNATVTSGIAARLRTTGHAELADEWEREPEETFAPSDVWRRVLSALGNDPHLLTPPRSEEISRALQALDAFALVHLVPGRDGHSGRALLTTAHGTVHEVLLPLLVDGPDSEVGRYLAMSDQQRREALPTLCSWAWLAAVGPLLRGVSGGLPWFVLVPTGALGVVPWHAAAGEGRTALREAGFTYAASARQLCELARRSRHPVGASPVVVSNPTGTLAATQYEAEFLHGLFPHGHFYGQAGPGVPVRGVGTPDEVLAASGASLQHLGCHARAGTTFAASALELARADLSVERMLRHAAVRRDGASGGLVVLAACESDLTIRLHDEVLTLAAAFVAAGATGVIGTKWKVDDVESALLMCVFYDFVANHGMRPRDALRAVQLWALDPDRVVPAGVARHLTERGRAAALADPVYWAAFAHHGW